MGLGSLTAGKLSQHRERTEPGCVCGNASSATHRDLKTSVPWQGLVSRGQSLLRHLQWQPWQKTCSSSELLQVKSQLNQEVRPGELLVGLSQLSECSPSRGGFLGFKGKAVHFFHWNLYVTLVCNSLCLLVLDHHFILGLLGLMFVKQNRFGEGCQGLAAFFRLIDSFLHQQGPG